MEGTFNTDLVALVRSVCGINAYDNQEEYLKGTEKPGKISMSQYLRRLYSIKPMLPHLKSGGTSLTVTQLNKHMISKNLLGRIGVEYYVAWGGGNSLLE